MSTSGGSTPDGTVAGGAPSAARARVAGLLLAAVALLGGGTARAAPAPGRDDPRFVGFLLDLGLAAEAAREITRLSRLGGAHAPADDQVFRAGLRLAAAGQAADAAALLVQAAAEADDPGVADQRHLVAGVVLLKAGAFPQAVQTFSRLEAFASTEAVAAQARRLRCIGHVFARDTGAARLCVPELISGSRDPEAASDLFDVLEIDSGRRAIVGGVLSALLPGLGQATAGEVGDGALALLVNGAWGLGVYLLVREAAILDAVLVAAGVGFRYYLGNIRNGAEAWRSAAETRRQAAAEDLMRRLARDPPRQAR